MAEGLSIEVIVLALANVGSMAYLVKRVADRVDLHAEMMPKVLQTLQGIADGQKELFKSRNNHETRLTEIETVHQIHGCDEPGQAPSRRRDDRRKP